MKKRAIDRIPANLKAEFFWSDRVNTGHILDLSENGFLIKTDSCPLIKAKFDLNIVLQDDVLKVPVKVRRIVKNDNNYDAIGVEIVNPPKEYLEYVDSLRWERIKGVKTSGQTIKLYVCKICHHIAFDRAPLNCPICSSTIESFEKAPEAIKKPDDFSELSEFEKKHIPVINILKENGYVNAHITVGEINHEMNIDDHISHIDFYYNAPFINKKCISRLSFNCEKMHPSTTLRFDNATQGVLTVISNCSAHGNWLSKITI
ncbi:MAG: PilZ domain-containing protein [Nitrospirae bacterium]|nr:PilZ domain-containing protein [Nitrospirota bacterium]